MVPKPNLLVIGILVIFVLIEGIPIILTLLFPSLCYGCSSIGQLHQYLNSLCGLSYINYMAYFVLLLYLAYLSTSLRNKWYTALSIVLCALAIYVPLWPLLNIITILQICIYRNGPFIPARVLEFPASQSIEASADKIIQEYDAYMRTSEGGCIRAANPGFSIEITEKDDACWRAIYLKKVGVIDETMRSAFPATCTLIEDVQIHNAFFSILDPGVEIPPHVGYYKGYLRYHLGVEIPNNDSPDETQKAYIVCGGQRYVWKKGEGVLFDDMFLHYVKNPANQRRAVLYLDIVRPSNNAFEALLNKAGIDIVENSPLVKAFVKNQHAQIKTQK